MPFPGTKKPIKIARLKPKGNLPARFEPSGIAWHPRLKKLIVVSDDGEVCMMNRDGSDIQIAVLDKHRKTDLEAITLANAQTDLIYIGTENPNTIIEWNVVTHKIIRRFNLEHIVPPAGNMGIEAIAFVPDKNHPEGGIFYVGYQKTGEIYRIELTIQSSATATDSKLLDHFIPLPGKTDLAGLTWDTPNQFLYGVWDKKNTLCQMDRNGKVLHQWKIPGKDQEGIVLINDDLFVAQDSGLVLQYVDFKP